MEVAMQGDDAADMMLLARATVAGNHSPRAT